MSAERPLPSDILSYVLPGEWVVLAGRTDAANDHLTVKLARAKDLWFHIRGMPGSHVVLRARDGDGPDKATIELAASIAAYHSKARHGGVVPVGFTEARHVSKPRGAKPGSVTMARESVIKVRPMTADVIARLKAPAVDPT